MRHTVARRGVAIGGVAFLLFVAGTGRAQGDSAPSIPEPLVATLHASSEQKGHGTMQAFDINGETSWCPKEDDPLGELAVSFPTAVTIESLVINVGSAKGSDAPLPSRVDVVVGDQTLSVDPRENGHNPFAITGATGHSTERVAIRFPQPGATRCLEEVTIVLREDPWVYGLESEAVRALPDAIAALTAALRSCNVRKMSSLVKFPFAYRERQAGFAGAELLYAHESKRTYANAKKLSEHCSSLVFPAGQQSPRIDRSIAPGKVRVLGGTGVTGVYWNLTWIKGRWWLVGAESATFE